MKRGVLLGIALTTASACNPDQELRMLEPAIAVSPDSLDFGDVVVDYSESISLEIINAGKNNLDISSIALLDGTLAFDHDGVATSVGVNDRLEVSVTCTPTTYTTYADIIEILSNDPDYPEILVPVSCTGVDAPTPDVTLDPRTIDFGTVTVDTSSSLVAILGNQGDGPLSILSTEQTGSGAFQILTDPQGISIDPGGDDEYAIVVIYSPTVPAEEEGAGDNGRLLIESDDPDEPSITLTLLGNGGGDYEYPVAVIDAVDETSPLETVELDGTGSYDPGDLELTYEWTLTELPDGSTTEITGAAADVASLFLDLTGDYEVQLVVENEDEIRSAPAKHIISAIPTEDLRVEMFWDTSNTDLDLHLLQSGYELFQVPYDCNYCNPNPDWGTGGDTSDDPTLDLDDITGFGPENINVTSPEDGEYEVYVHYFEDNGGGATAVTVRVYLNKVLEYKETEVLEHNQLWHVGTITWPDALVVEDETSEPSSAGRRGCFED